MYRMLFGLTLFALAGCAASQPDYNPNNGSLTYPDEASRNAAVRDWDVQCDNFNDCPDSVAQLVFVNGSTSVSMCTGFLAQDGKTIVTNDHCVENFSVGDSCKGQIFAIFPETNGHRKQAVNCNRIQSRSKKTEFKQADIAVIQLDQTLSDRRALQVSSKSLLNGTTLDLYKVDPKYSDYNAGWGNKLVKSSCRVIEHPFFLPDFTKDSDPVIPTTDCEVIAGNSGSPLVDGDHNVRAVIYGHLGRDELGSIISGFVSALFNRQSESLMDHPDLRGRNFNFATNIKCLDAQSMTVNLDFCPTPDAQTDIKLVEKVADAKFNETIKGVMMHAISWAEENSQPFMWMPKFVKSSGDHDQYPELGEITMEPLCVRNSPEWKENYRTGNIPLFKYATKANSFYEVPRYYLLQGYDRNLNYSVEKSKSSNTVSIDFSPSALSWDKGGPIQSTSFNQDSGLVTPVAAKLPPCGQLGNYDGIRAQMIKQLSQ